MRERVNLTSITDKSKTGVQVISIDLPIFEMRNDMAGYTNGLFDVHVSCTQKCESENVEACAAHLYSIKSAVHDIQTTGLQNHPPVEMSPSSILKCWPL